MGKSEKIGIVVMFNISTGGGAPRVVVDLIDSLDSIGHEVYLLTPYKLNKKKIASLYESIKLKEVYNPHRFRSFFCKDVILSRKFMIGDFKKFANKMDRVIDVDGGVFHKYLPNDFDKKNYFIWRLSCPGAHDNIKMKLSLVRKLKNLVRSLLRVKPTKNRHFLDDTYNIYAVDRWTRKQLINYWGLSSPEICLYPEIHTEELLYKKGKKKNQAVIFGRLSPNKLIEESLEVFAKGTKDNLDYNLVIFGGVTNDSEDYVKYLKGLIDKWRISDRVEIIKQPSFQKLKKLLLESKILIEAQRDVSLTMTSIEAMAAGCVVLAHKNGGTYSEVLDDGKYGHGFESVADGAEELKKIIKNINKEDIKKSMQRAKFFSRENFVKRLKVVLDGK